MMVFMKDQTNKVTLDSLYKEMLFSSLPADVQRSMADKVEALDADATAQLADSYFDKDGKLLIPSASINAVAEPMEEVDEELQESEVNAAFRHRQASSKPQGRRLPFRQGSKVPSQGHASNASSTGSAAASASTSSKSTGKSSLKKICRFHLKFKEKAFSCEPGCVHWEAMKEAGNGNTSHRQ